MNDNQIRFYKKVYMMFGNTFTCSDIVNTPNLREEFTKYSVIHPHTLDCDGYATRDNENLTYTFTQKFIDIISK